jgi:hypothetical protein
VVFSEQAASEFRNGVDTVFLLPSSGIVAVEG